jgi:hypothetical protein
MATTSDRTGPLATPPPGTAAPIRPPRSGPVVVMASFGALVLVFTLWVWGRWLLSDDFRPVDPGPDPISTGERIGLIALQSAGVLAVVYLLWRFLIQPWRRTGRVTTDGLILLMLPFMWFWDPWMNYSQNWFTYNAHLVNMGSWTSQVPGFVAPHQDRMLEPLLVGFAYIWWVFPYMLLGCYLLDKMRARWPSMGMAGVLFWGCLGSIVIEAGIEIICILLGFYAFPGVPDDFVINAGSRYQYSLVYAVIAGIGCFAWVAVRYFKDDRGYTLAERGVQYLNISEGRRTVVRFLALLGGMTLSIAVFNLLCQFLALHSGPWPVDMPSYLTTTCPDHATDPASCGGPGIPIPRSDG